ncbi:MAG: LytR family transcriptional regulator [Chloroflexi bacterium]|nr:LytR family transcriptional regulator [Chloroflexota bacterium]
MRRFIYWTFVLGVTAALAGAIAYAARPWYDAARVVANVTGQTLPTSPKPTFTPVPPKTRTSAHASPTPTIAPLKSPSGRVNYLLLASDNDAKKHQGAAPDTQVIIFVSFDTVRKQIYMVSIPRDLWVPIPGFQTNNKIDTAPEYGGLATVRSAVEANFHVTINYYAWVGLKGFVNIINSLGGVDIVVSHPMVENDFPDDLNPAGPTYAIRRFFIPAGPQHLDGVTALEYVRARHADLIGDFGRSQRQQQVLLQIKHKMKSMDIGTVPSIVQDLSGEFSTDLSMPTVLSLASSVLSIDSKSIHHYYLDQTHGYTSNQKSPDGQQDILVGTWPKINALFQCIMSDKAYLGCKNS